MKLGGLLIVLVISIIIHCWVQILSSKISISNDSNILSISGWISPIHRSVTPPCQDIRIHLVQSTSSEEKIFQEAWKAHESRRGKKMQRRINGELLKNWNINIYESMPLFGWMDEMWQNIIEFAESSPIEFRDPASNCPHLSFIRAFLPLSP